MWENAGEATAGRAKAVRDHDAVVYRVRSRHELYNGKFGVITVLFYTAVKLAYICRIGTTFNVIAKSSTSKVGKFDRPWRS